MFIFGWGRTTVHPLGRYGPAPCANCRNVTRFRHFRKRVWFTLFFVPVIPYETHDRLTCEVCNAGWDLHGRLPQSVLPQLAPSPTSALPVARGGSGRATRVICPDGQCGEMISIWGTAGEKATCPTCSTRFDISRATVVCEAGRSVHCPNTLCEAILVVPDDFEGLAECEKCGAKFDSERAKPAE